MAGPTHYDTLRVPPSATDGQIRDAYRRLARDHHPDRQASSGSAAGSIPMPAINEAYRVLSDPARRVVYDATLRGATASAGTEATSHSAPNESSSNSSERQPMHPSHVGPARIPWRTMSFVGLVGIIAVVVLAQFSEPGEPAGPDGIMGVGSCVSLEPNGDAREILCVNDPEIDLVVRAFIPFDGSCPGGTLPHRDRQGMGVVCVEFP